MYSANIKSEVINNIIFAMSDYLDVVTLDVLKKVIEAQLVAVNMEEITTLPAAVRESVEEQNRYYVSLMLIKKRKLAKETKQQYVDSIKRLMSIIDKPLSKMDENDIDYYLAWYEQRNVAAGGRLNQASTCNNERRYLSAFFTWMRRERFMTYNPVEATEPQKEVKKPIDYFRPSQMEELKEGCRSLRDRAIIEVLRSTGARVGEVPQINRSHLDWHTGDILILSEKSGKYRTLYVDEVARYHLKKYLDQRCCIEYFETAIEALEKQLPKKVEIWNGQATCPNCKKLYGNMVDIKQLHPASWDFEYCKHCGQRLDW